MMWAADSSKGESRGKSIKRTQKYREAESACAILTSATACQSVFRKQGAACARRRRQELAEGETPFWEDEWLS